jgi:hypothetical protein
MSMFTLPHLQGTGYEFRKEKGKILSYSPVTKIIEWRADVYTV